MQRHFIYFSCYFLKTLFCEIDNLMSLHGPIRRRLGQSVEPQVSGSSKRDGEFSFALTRMDTGDLGQPLFIRYFAFVLIRFGLNFPCHPASTHEHTSKLQFVMLVEGPIRGLVAMENLARSFCDKHGWTEQDKITLFREKWTDRLLPCFARRRRQKAAIMLLTFLRLRRTLIYLTIFRACLCFASLVFSW